MASTTGRQILVAAAALGVSPAAFAYLDPGTGSMLLQLLIAGVLGALFTIKMYWYRFKGFFARLMGKEPADPDPANPDKPDGASKRPGTPD